MKFLIVDNGTFYLPQLKKLLSKQSFTVVSYTDLPRSNPNTYDAIILSGGHRLPLVGNENEFNYEISLIKSCKKPILGICFGFELIAFAYGARLKCLDVKEHGIIDIQIQELDQLFANIPNFKVFENHRWLVSQTPKELIALAKSEKGIEAVKHISKPIYGVQFHPEIFVKRTCGDEVFSNFLSLVKQTLS